jgi:hypothetical protein
MTHWLPASAKAPACSSEYNCIFTGHKKSRNAAFRNTQQAVRHKLVMYRYDQCHREHRPNPVFSPLASSQRPL